MKKIIVEQKIKEALGKKNTFLDRSDMLVLTASSSDEILSVLREERAELIITSLDLQGISSEQFGEQIRTDAALKDVSIIMVCANNPRDIERCTPCGANVVIVRPYKPDQLLSKARKLLRVSLRETYRVLLSVAMEGVTTNATQFCRTLDISSTGLLMETDLTFKPGDRVKCSFYLPDANTTHIESAGEVVRIIPPSSAYPANRYGIHFLDLESDAATAIQHYLEQQSSK